MGISGGQTVKTKETATPNLPATAKPGVDSYFGEVSNLFNTTNPSDFYTPINAIQQGVFDNVGAGTDLINKAASRTNSALGGFQPFSATQTLDRAQLGQANYAQAPAMDRAQLGEYTPVDLSGATGSYKAQSAEPIDYWGAGTAEAGRAIDYLDDYQPYANKALVDNTMASFDDQAGRQTAAYQAMAAKRGRFGGSRQAIGEAQMAADISRNAGLTRAQMEDAALTRALGAAAGDANLFTNTSIANANNVTQANVSRNSLEAQRSMFDAGEANKFGLTGLAGAIQGELANAGYANQNNLAQFGADNSNNQLQYQTQANLNQNNANTANQFGLAQFGADNTSNLAQYQGDQQNAQFNAGLQMDQRDQRLAAAGQLGNLGLALNQDAGTRLNIGNALQDQQAREQLAPATRLSILQELLYGGGLLGATSGTTVEGTQKQSGGLLQSLLGAGASLGSAAIAASERRVKRDIRLLGHEDDGLGVYAYNYVWDEDDELPRFGVMVDEVERIRPWALGPVVDGIQTVNYGAL